MVHRVSEETHKTAHLVTKPSSKVLTNSNLKIDNIFVIVVKVWDAFNAQIVEIDLTVGV